MTGINSEKREDREVATLGGGCFWCTEAVFSRIRGVEKVESGYSGGDVKNPSYEQVSTGTTRHVEVVQISFDPRVITYEEILEIFFATHDPTTLNRQGVDVGTQYRSVIFYHDEQQRQTAEKVIQQLNSEEIFGSPIVTKIEPFKTFYEAEEYHRDYFKRHPEQAYCQVVIAPKIAKLQEHYMSKLKLQI
jgi:peptide-methionine (S)-S-oxide reductase